MLGDSITHGFGGTGFAPCGEKIVGNFYRNPSGHCWAKTFKDFMEEHYNCEVNNNGCTGVAIEFLIEHWDTLVADEDDIIICTIGTNNRHVYFGSVNGQKPTKEEVFLTFYNNIVI